MIDINNCYEFDSGLAKGDNMNKGKELQQQQQQSLARVIRFFKILIHHAHIFTQRKTIQMRCSIQSLFRAIATT